MTNLKDIALVVFDFDGVLTDNGVYVSGSGEETVRCDRSDGLGVRMLREAGVPMMIVSLETHPVVAARAEKLRIPCHQGVEDKAAFLRKHCEENGIDMKTVAYVGNDVNDLPSMKIVGLPVAVADAYPPVLAAATLVLAKNGGHGAVREFCDMLLAARMIELAVMQGRLSPPEDGRIQCFPRATWKEEFARAKESGVPAIEWIDDTYGADINPLRTESGVRELRSLMREHGVRIPSVCADSFMEQPLVRCTDDEHRRRLELLRLLIRRAALLGAGHIGIPLLDNAALRTPEEIASVAASLQSVVPLLASERIELHIESSLKPADLASLIGRIGSPLVRVTYDMGNSASLGYDPREEFAAYGALVGSVHIKDRKNGGGTVPPGTGDTDFASVAAQLNAVAFRGLFTLQVARGETGKEVQTIRSYAEFAAKTFGRS